MPAAEAQVPSLDARVNLDVVENDLSLVVQVLRDLSGANIVILEGGDQKVRALKLSDVYWRDALDFAAEIAGCVVDEDKSGVLSISRPKRVTFSDDIDLREVISSISKLANANIVMGPESSTARPSLGCRRTLSKVSARPSATPWSRSAATSSASSTWSASSSRR